MFKPCFLELAYGHRYRFNSASLLLSWFTIAGMQHRYRYRSLILEEYKRKECRPQWYGDQHDWTTVQRIGHLWTCVYPDMCLGIGNVSGKPACCGTMGPSRYTKCLRWRPTESLGRRGKGEGYLPDTLLQEGGLHQIQCQSVNMHQGKHRPGG